MTPFTFTKCFFHIVYVFGTLFFFPSCKSNFLYCSPLIIMNHAFLVWSLLLFLIVEFHVYEKKFSLCFFSLLHFLDLFYSFCHVIARRVLSGP